MDETMKELLADIELGEMQRHENMAVFPITLTGDGSPDYLTLREALEEAVIEVRERSRDGSVNELRLENQADRPVLLLDGEELAGAKQNRVLIATILVASRTGITIPVNCTEAGRWSYVSESFSDSGHHMSPHLRLNTYMTLAHNLGGGGGYRADQRATWDGIGDMSRRLHRSSPTSAMRDYYEQSGDDLKDYREAFESVPHQRGVLVMVNGEVAGMEMVSRESAYKSLHTKLMESYAMEALLRSKRRGGRPLMKKARDFLDEIPSCEEKEYKSVGLGYDHRFRGKRVVGSALIYEDKVIHSAFFRKDNSREGEGAEGGRMTAYSRRRDFRPYDVIN